MSSSKPIEKPNKPWTLGAIRQMNLQLEAACKEPGCGWFATLDIDRLIDEFGPDLELPTNGAGLTCAKCGAPVAFGLAFVKPQQNGAGWN